MRGWVPAAVLAVLLAGCGAGPQATPTPQSSAERTALTPQILGLLLEEHLGHAYAVSSEPYSRIEVVTTTWVDGIGAQAHFRATPDGPARTITVRFSPEPYSGTICAPGSCTERDGVLVRPAGPISVRDAGLVQVTASGPDFPDDLLEPAIALARDPRIAATTDAGLAAEASANPRWRTDDLGCGDAQPTGPIPLPPADAAPSEPPTPQALAAVIAGRVAGSCAGDEFGAGTVYLGDDSERVSLSVAEAPIRCDQLEQCEQRGEVTIARQFDRGEASSPVTVWLSRPTPDGRHWVVVEHASVRAIRSHDFPVPLETLLALVSDQRVGPLVDPALNRAGDELPLRWRLNPRTVE